MVAVIKECHFPPCLPLPKAYSMQLCHAPTRNTSPTQMCKKQVSPNSKSPFLRKCRVLLPFSQDSKFFQGEWLENLTVIIFYVLYAFVGNLFFTFTP